MYNEVSLLTISGVFSALFTLCLSCVARYTPSPSSENHPKILSKIV